MSHGWYLLAPFSRDSHDQTLSHRECYGAQVLTWQVAPGSKGLSVEIAGSPGTDAALFVEQRVKRALVLEWDPSDAIAAAQQCGPAVADFIRAGGGRFLRGSTFYEDFVKTLCTINTTWRQTVAVVERLVRQLGDGAMPTPIHILEAGSQLQHLGLGYRALVLQQATERLLESGLLEESGNSVASTILPTDLLKLKGIGPYAANHLAVLQGDFREIPHDSGVREYLLERFGVSGAQADQLFACWGDYRFLGYKLSRILSKDSRTG